VSGCKFWQDMSWEQGAAKTMTNNLPILSVLGLVVCPELLQGTKRFFEVVM
jgi:hypothetical protein